jgi:hypothetical protein
MQGITPFESVVVFFFSSLILALPEGLCTSPPHLSPHDKYLKNKNFGTSPWLIISTMAVSDLETKFSTLKTGVPQNRYISKRAGLQYLSNNTTL